MRKEYFFRRFFAYLRGKTSNEVYNTSAVSMYKIVKCMKHWLKVFEMWFNELSIKYMVMIVI